MSTPPILVASFLVCMTVMSLLMPGYTRPDLFFGVTVFPEFRRTAQARAITRFYRAGLCGVAAAALAVVLSAHRPAMGLVAQVLGTCAMLVWSHHLAARYASPRCSVVEVDLTAQPEHMPGGAPAALAPLVWLMGLGAWAALDTARLPARIILHHGRNGTERFVETTPLTVLTVVGVPALACLVMATAAYGVLHRSRRITTTGPAAAGERAFRRLTITLVLYVEYLLAMLPLLMLLSAPTAWMWGWAIALWVTLLVFVVRLARAGQGGTRLAAPVMGALPVGDRTDDAHWLGGMIYFNRADPALFVEKRMGIGWTLNVGHFLAWLFIALTVAIPLSLRISRSRMDTPETRAEATTAALTWLNAVDAGEYTHSWDMAARRFKESVQEDQWVVRIAALRARLGTVESRSAASLRVAGALGSAAGERVVIQFYTRFAQRPEAVETVTPMRDVDGAWRVSGYYVK